MHVKGPRYYNIEMLLSMYTSFSSILPYQTDSLHSCNKTSSNFMSLRKRPFYFDGRSSRSKLPCSADPCRVLHP